MKLVTFTHDKRTQLGELDGDKVYVLAGPDTMRMNDVLRRGITPNRLNQSFPLAEVTLNAPLHPGKVIAIGLNYAKHAAETGAALPPAPIIFAKFPSSVIGPGQAITWSKSITNQVDWEVELGIVIGKKARNVTEEDALKHVYGYTVANDVSARDLQIRIDRQWTRGKSLDTFCPLGPCIVTRSAIPDPNKLNLKTVINGKVMQDSNTEDLIFNVQQLISYCSRMFTLEPGDVILTGTPSGVGEGMKPPQYLKDGDQVTVSVEGIGEMTNPCKELD
jgi:2-keto-4-pentenoate hydratase/2-oxohepta-3-ene-1,7-dioic acid hydratase in catechol pathway